MKPPSDDEINGDQLVVRAIMGPEFQSAWETLEGSGIGSTEAPSHVSNLIRGSRWRLERLHIQHETLMETVQEFNAAQLNQATFECQLLVRFLRLRRATWSWALAMARTIAASPGDKCKTASLRPVS